MPIYSALQVVGDGPGGVKVLTADRNGVYDEQNAGFITAFERVVWPLLAGSLDSFIWVCTEGIWQIASVREAHTVVGGASAAVTVVVCPQAVAIASGVVQLTAVLDLTITAPAGRAGTLITTPTKMTVGDAVAVDFSGTLTGLVGAITVSLKKVG